MLLPRILFFYILKLHARSFALITFLFSICIYLGNIFDILNRARSNFIGIKTLLTVSFFKVPYIVNEAIPICVLISTLYLILNYLKNNQILVIMMNNISIWKFMQPIIFFAFICGVLSTFIIQPVSSYFLDKFDHFELKQIHKQSSSVAISKTGILVLEKDEIGKRVIIAKTILEDDKKLLNSTILIFDDENNFLERIDSDYLIVQDEQIMLVNNVIENSVLNSSFKEKIFIPTKLTFENITKRFKYPENVSFWKLGEYVTVLSPSGINTERFSTYYYKLISKPFFTIACALLGLCFIALEERRKNTNRIMSKGIILGFIIYGSTSILTRILVFKDISPALGNLLPILLIMSFSIFYLTHKFEE